MKINIIKYGIKIFGTSYDSLALAENRGRFSDLLKKNKIPFIRYGTKESASEISNIYFKEIILHYDNDLSKISEEQ